MSLKLCPECQIRKEIFVPSAGICRECYQRRQDEEDRREFINTSFPDGVIAKWNATPSFLDKKRNYMYFRIPDTQNRYFDHNKIYEITISEAKT